MNSHRYSFTGLFLFLSLLLISTWNLAKDEASKVLDISIGSLDGRIAVTATLSAAVNSKVDLSSWLSIRNRQGDVIEGAWVVGDNAKVLYFTNIEPEQHYLIQIESGLPLAQGGKLAQGDRQQVAVDPITPMLGFAGNGNLLASSLSDGLAVLSVNVPLVDVDFYRIEKGQLVSFLSENSRRGQLAFWQAESYLNSHNLVYSARFDLKLARNQSATSYLPVKHIAPLQQQGIYLAVMRQAGDYNYNFPVTWFAISDLGIHMRLYEEGARISVSSLATAEPQAAVALRLLDGQGRELAVAQSDAQGLAAFSAKQLAKAKLLFAVKGGQTSLIRLFGPALDLSEFPVEGIQASVQRLFFYSERDLYRPGESVRISALLRDSDGKMLPAQVLNFSLQQPDGKVVSQQKISAAQLGYYESRWQIPADAPTGQWNISAQTADGQRSRYAIKVEEFLPQRMALTLDAPQQLDRLEPLRIDVKGEYLYGAPAAGNALQSELISRSVEHPFKRFADFYFSNPQIKKFNRRDDLADTVLGAQGQLSVMPKAHWRQTSTPLEVSLYASLLDSGGRPVSRASRSLVLPADQLVGLRPLFAEDTVPYDSTAHFEILLSDGEQHFAAKGLMVRLVREKRNYHWRYSEGEGWRSDYTERHYVVSQQTIDTSSKGATKIAIPVEWGHYRIEVENPATKLVTGYRFRAGWSADETVLAGRPDRIGLALSNSHYRAGDQVEVEIKAPAAGKGFLLVEGATEHYRMPLDIPQEGGKVRFRLDPAWQTHDLYVSVLLIQPGNERDQRLPKRMMGIIPLPLARGERQLKIAMALEERIRPGRQLRVPIKVSSSSGEALAGKVQLTLAAVDVGVLNISRFETPDPFAGFFSQRAYRVKARDSYADLIDADAGVLAELKFGGDQDSLRGREADANVQIVSLFSGVVEVSAQGDAEVILDIPAFNGRLRLMAVAFGEDSFGAQQQDVDVAAPLVTQLTTPRFLRAGDRAFIALDIDNLSGAPQQLELQMELGQGLKLLPAVPSASTTQYRQTLTLGKAEKRTIYLPISATSDYGVANIDLTMHSLNTAEPLVARQWQLSILPAWARSGMQWQAVLSAGDRFALGAEDVEAFLTTDLSAQLNVSSVPPLDIASHFNALKAYPYGCLEQTASGVFPQLYINDDLLRQLSIEGSDRQARHAAINLAIQRLLGMQRGSGGFGLWSEQSPEEHWLSVYVLDFMLRARDRGYAVPDQGLAKAQQRVAAFLRNPEKVQRYDQDLSAQQVNAVRSYAAQVLSREGLAPLSILRQIFDRDWNRATPMSLVQLGLALNAAGDTVRGEEAIARGVAVEHFASDYNRYGSPVRDLALTSFWLLEAGHEKWQPLLLALPQYLSRRDWLSTQERNALFLLGSALQQREGELMDFTLSVGGQALSKQLARFSQRLEVDDLRAGVAIANSADREIYLNMRVQGYTEKPPAAMNNGLSVTRRFFSMAGEPVKMQQVRSGDKFVVELSVRAAQRTPQALVVDLLPAGFEIENQNLADGYAQDQLQIDGESIEQRMAVVSLKHQEYREDRYVAALDLPAQQTQQLYYLVRAVSAGTFNVAPTFAEDMYSPQIRHTGAAGGTVRILAR